MAGTPFSLDADQVGGRLHIDGFPVPPDQVLGVEVVVTPTDPTRLIVHVRSDGVIEGEGIVEVVRDGLAGDRVRALDPNKVRARFAAESQGMGESAAGRYIAVIADMLDEAGPA